MNQGFNPKARWDRHIPETDQHSSQEELDERIEVLTWFRNGKIIPQLFLWNGKEYRIEKITYHWQERSGSAQLNCFSVDTGTNLYQISFNNISYSWRLVKIIS